MSEQKSLLYVADPMCSWCWGFAPVVDAIVEHVGDSVPLNILVGGLAPDTQDVMGETTKATIREHWDHVSEATGQPFDYAFLDRVDFVYNTEPACRAVVAARRLQPRQNVAFLRHLHAAFYGDNQDITAATTLTQLGADFGFDGQEFARTLNAEDVAEATRRDFALARELGVSGFPSLLGHADGRLRVLTSGYQPWRRLMHNIDAWLQS